MPAPPHDETLVVLKTPECSPVEFKCPNAPWLHTPPHAH
jgi:hypothetical protein